MDDVPPVPPISAAERPVFRDRWQRLGLNSLTLSILAHVFFGLIAAYLIVQAIPAKSKQTSAAPPSNPDAPSRALEHKVQMQRKQQTMSAPAAIKRITTTSNTKVALPAMPAMPVLDAAVMPLAMAAMGGTVANLGRWGGGSGGGSGPRLFGLRTGGEGLRGTFYDLKQTRNKTPTSIKDVPAFVHQLDLFLQSGWNESLLSQYFRAPTPLYATQIFVPLIASEQAPKAFGVENEVQPALWMALYKGQVSPPESGTYYFVGGGDNILIVRLRGSIVFDKSWNYHELFGIDRSWRPTAIYDYGYGNTPGGFSRGQPVELKRENFTIWKSYSAMTAEPRTLACSSKNKVSSTRRSTACPSCPFSGLPETLRRRVISRRSSQTNQSGPHAFLSLRQTACSIRSSPRGILPAIWARLVLKQRMPRQISALCSPNLPRLSRQ